jgi:hypothetical protein
MLKLLPVFLCAMLPLWCGEHQSPGPIALYVDFQNQPPAPVLEAIEQEVDIVMAPMGAEFEWRSLQGVRGGEVSSQLAVVKFLGRCESTGPSPSHAVKPGALGWTHVSEGTILPFSDIDCDGIRHFLQIGLLSVSNKERDESYGRALGRVLAHELYHIFANTAHHGSNGVGKAVYSVHDLLTPDFRFQDHESDLLRANRPRPVVDVVDGTH